MTVIKVNAYGHGMLEMVEAVISVGATWLGVATLNKALDVRSNVSPSVPNLVLGYVAPQYLSLVSRFCITVTGVSLEWIQEAAQIVQQPSDFHLKVDTGFNRLGCKTIDEVRAAMKIISLNPNMNCTRVFTFSNDIQNKSFFIHN